MLKPEIFKKAHIALRNTPYQMLAQHAEGGVLGRGSIVWTRDAVAAYRHVPTLAFIEEIGTVLIDARWFRLTDPSLP